MYILDLLYKISIWRVELKFFFVPAYLLLMQIVSAM